MKGIFSRRSVSMEGVRNFDIEQVRKHVSDLMDTIKSLTEENRRLELENRSLKKSLKTRTFIMLVFLFTTFILVLKEAVWR